MGKASILIVIGFTVMGAMYALSINQGTSSTHAEVSDHQHEMLARNAAKVGMNRARTYITDEYRRNRSFSSHQFEGDYEGVEYDVEVRATGGGSEVVITSVGMAVGSNGKEIPFTIKSRYKEQPSGEGLGIVPRFMEPVLLSDGTINMRGNSDIDVLDAEGNEENRLNADIHSNSDLVVNGNANVRGFGTASRDFKGTGNMNFDPYANPNNAQTTEGGLDPIEIPEFNASQFVDAMENDHGATVIRDGGVEIGGDSELDLASFGGTRENPTVWYIDGKLDITSSVELPEYLLIVTAEGFEVNGNITMGESPGGSESTFGIYTAKDGVINDNSIGSGNLTVHGQIFGAEGVNVNVAGNFDLYGNMSTGGEMDLRGNIHARYLPASPALTAPWNEPEMEVQLVTHNEW